METLDEPVLVRHRLDVDQYHRMAEAGVLAPDARVELIDGEIIDMAPIGTRHWSAVSRLNKWLVGHVGDAALVSVQQSLRLGRQDEPEPDIALLKPRADFYAGALPTGADALLVIEVADSTVAFDLRTKARLYATHGVRVYWVIDLANDTLHVHAAPRDGGYETVVAWRRAPRATLPDPLSGDVDLAALWA